MAQEPRPTDWEWVKQIGLCKAETMFGRLRELAKRDMLERNKQLRNDKFELVDITGLQFSIGDTREYAKHVFFKVTDDLKSIVVCGFNGANEAVYAVSLDDAGVCRFKRDGAYVDFWQLLKAALEPIFFGQLGV
jgi:hypothetical protein